MPECLFCRQRDRGARLEYAPSSGRYCHRACLRPAPVTAPRAEPQFGLARELGLLRPAPGRQALECPRGHRYEGENLLLIRQAERTVRKCRQCCNERQRAARKRGRKPQDARETASGASPALGED